MIPRPIRIDADDKRSADNLLIDGWREIEVLETYRGKPDGRNHDFIRRGIGSDMAACIKIATTVFRHDRLHADPLVEPAIATKAKEQWVRDCFGSKEGAVFVYANPILRGFIAVKWLGDGLMIDLIATDTPRKRICTKLVQHVMAELKPAYLRAGTQLSNQEGRLFYSALGMTCIKRQRTFHKP